MRIVLIYPPNEMHRVSYNVTSRRRKRYGHLPPLGVGHIAGIAESAGHEVKIVDGVANGYSIDECAELVKEMSPDLVGLSVMTHVKNEASVLAGRIKALMPGVRVVVGGTHAYYFYRDILREMPDVDFVLYGEVERSWEKFLSVIESPVLWPEIAGLCFRADDGQVVTNRPPEVIQDLDEVPPPAWHLYDFSLYQPLPFQSKGKRFFALSSSRGCPYGKCAFCYEAGRDRQMYRRCSPARVVRDMKTLHEKYGVDEFNFYDDSFVAETPWLTEFSNLMRQEAMPIHWTCSGKVNYVTREKLELIKDVGCWSIFFGVESGNQDLLQGISKGIKLDHARRAVRWTNELGIETRCAFMLGLPGETPEKGRETIEFAIELDPTYAIFYATFPRYGTRLYDMALVQGSFISKEFKGMAGVTYVPSGYKGVEELKGMVRSAYTQFYLRPRQMLKYVGKMRTFSDLRHAVDALDLFLGLRGGS